MLDDNTADYYRARQVRENDLAARASNPAIAAIHRDLADRYRERIEQVSMTARIPA